MLRMREVRQAQYDNKLTSNISHCPDNYRYVEVYIGIYTF